MLIIEKIVDITTNEETLIEREETAEETQLRIEKEELLAKNLAEFEVNKIKKNLLLERLGISEEEAKLLLS